MAVLLGLGIGALSATVLSLVFWAVLAFAGLDDAALVGLTLAILASLAIGGYAAGRMAPVAQRFHGSVAGLAVAGLVLAIARFGGSPAPTIQVLWLSLLAVVLGGAGGTFAGRRKTS
jgi:putative membrane protein (TIGR04086 family)